MIATRKSLASVCAADLMSRDVVFLPAEMSLVTAARMLHRSEISGAPVVDCQGCCIGVLSTTDFMHAREVPPDQMSLTGHQRDVLFPWEIPNEASEELRVRDFMTSDPVTVTPETCLADLVRLMLEAHVHRLIVTDPAGRPLGVVSTTDVLAALARVSGIELNLAECGCDHTAAHS